MSTAVELDDEMEAMLREIEGMGMTPEAPVPATAAPAAPAPAPAAPVAEVGNADEEMAALEAMLKSDIENIGDTADIHPSAAIDDSADIADIDAAVAAIEAKPAPAPAPAPEKVVTAADLAKARLKAEGFIEPAPSAKIEPDRTEAKEPDNEVKPKPASATPPKTEAPKRPAAASSSTSDILDPDQIKRDIAINPTDLDTALIEHPGLQLHYALKTADARRAYERLKSGVEILEAQLDSKYREELFDGGKKPTEAAIRNAVVGDPKYAAAQAKLIDAQHLWKMCEAVESSFHSRKDILLEVARDRRKEKEGAMRVMEETDLRGKVDAMMRKS